MFARGLSSTRNKDPLWLPAQAINPGAQSHATAIRTKRDNEGLTQWRPTMGRVRLTDRFIGAAR